MSLSLGDSLDFGDANFTGGAGGYGGAQGYGGGSEPAFDSGEFENPFEPQPPVPPQQQYKAHLNHPAMDNDLTNTVDVDSAMMRLYYSHDDTYDKWRGKVYGAFQNPPAWLGWAADPGKTLLFFLLGVGLTFVESYTLNGRGFTMKRGWVALNIALAFLMPTYFFIVKTVYLLGMYYARLSHQSNTVQGTIMDRLSRISG
jgi:hypothetical protein